MGCFVLHCLFDLLIDSLPHVIASVMKDDGVPAENHQV